MKVIGIDVGGTSVKFGVVSTDGSVTHKKSFDTRDWQDTKGFHHHLIDAIISYTSTYPECKKVGIGFPGLLDLERRNIVLLPNIQNMKDIPFLDLLEEKLPHIEVNIENDAKCAALGEHKFGQFPDQKDFLMITLGTGVGSGLVIDGQLFKGGRGNPLEIGHILTKTGKVLEKELGNQQFSVYTQSKLKDYPNSSLNGQEITPKAIHDAAIEGDELALHSFQRFGNLLGEAILSAIRLFDINTIVIGGGVSGASDIFLPEVNRLLQEYLPDYYLEELIIRVATLHNEAGICGAASLVL